MLALSIVTVLQCVQDSVQTGAVLPEIQKWCRLHFFLIHVMQGEDSQQVVDPGLVLTGADHCMLSRA